jgi:hypothetical protein
MIDKVVDIFWNVIQYLVNIHDRRSQPVYPKLKTGVFEYDNEVL